MNSSRSSGSNPTVLKSSSIDSAPIARAGPSLSPEENLVTLLRTYYENTLDVSNSSDQISRDRVQACIQNLAKTVPRWILQEEEMKALDALPQNILSALQALYDSTAGGTETPSITLCGCTHIPTWLTGFSNGAELTFKDLKWIGEPFDFGSLAKQFHHAPVVFATNFRNVNLQHSDFSGVIFQTCNLSHANFSETTLHRTKFSNVNLHGTNVRGAKGIEQAGFTRCYVSSLTKLPVEFGDSPLLHPEDMLRSNSTLLFNKYDFGAFDYEDKDPLEGIYSALRKVSWELGFNTIECHLKTRWVRDFFYKSDVGNLDTPAKVNSIYLDDLFTDNGRTSRDCLISPLANNHKDTFHSTPFDGNIPNAATKSRPATTIEDETEAIDKDLDIFISHMVPQYEKCFIPGGNMFITEDRHCIVGADEVRFADLPNEETSGKTDASISSELMERIRVRFPSIKDDTTAIRAWRLRKAAKQELAAMLGVKKVTIVPQWLFHIDLQMAYLGDKTFLIHSFDEALAFAHEHESDLKAELGKEKFNAFVAINTKLQKHLQPRINLTVKRLKAAGLDPVTCCGGLITKELDNGKVDASCFHSSFLNGLTFQADNGEKTFLTLDANNSTIHKKYFLEIVKRHASASVRYIRDEADPLADPQSILRNKSGGLRCVTNQNVISIFNK
jgi:hypothetical protein